MANQAGILCNTPIHTDGTLVTGTTTTTNLILYVNQGVFYANEGTNATTINPPPLTWANYTVHDSVYGHKSVMPFCRTGFFVTGTDVEAFEDFWPQFYRPHFSNRTS